MFTLTESRGLQLLAYLILALIPIACLSIAFSSLIVEYPELATGITYDLTLTTSLLYLFLIWKTKIPKTTVVPFFVVGIIIASYILPADQQFHLGLIKTWVLPFVEISVLSFVGFSVYKTVKTFRKMKNQDSDVLTVLQKTSDKMFGIPLLANAIAFEIAVFYYGLIRWKKFAQSSNTFSYHKNSGKTALFLVIIFIIAIETVVLHILVAQWNVIIAWILTASSAYVLIQIFGHFKAIFQRPIEVIGDKLLVRYGLFGGAEIDLGNIKTVTSAAIKPNNMTGVKQVSLLADLEQFNTKIELNESASFSGFYGIKDEFKTLLLFVDEPEKFRELITNDSD